MDRAEAYNVPLSRAHHGSALNSLWQKSRNSGNAGETACATFWLQQLAEPGGAGIQPEGCGGARAKKPSSSEYLNGAEDRKSTRLNSSHSQISYAVFCLKKKRKRHN